MSDYSLTLRFANRLLLEEVSFPPSVGTSRTLGTRSSDLFHSTRRDGQVGSFTLMTFRMSGSGSGGAHHTHTLSMSPSSTSTHYQLPCERWGNVHIPVTFHLFGPPQTKLNCREDPPPTHSLFPFPNCCCCCPECHSFCQPWNCSLDEMR